MKHPQSWLAREARAGSASRQFAEIIGPSNPPSAAKKKTEGAGRAEAKPVKPVKPAKSAAARVSGAASASASAGRHKRPRPEESSEFAEMDALFDDPRPARPARAESSEKFAAKGRGRQVKGSAPAPTAASSSAEFADQFADPARTKPKKQRRRKEGTGAPSADLANSSADRRERLAACFGGKANQGQGRGGGGAHQSKRKKFSMS